ALSDRPLAPDLLRIVLAAGRWNVGRVVVGRQGRDRGVGGGVCSDALNGGGGGGCAVAGGDAGSLWCRSPAPVCRRALFRPLLVLPALPAPSAAAAAAVKIFTPAKRTVNGEFVNEETGNLGCSKTVFILTELFSSAMVVTSTTTTAIPAPLSEEHQTRLLEASELACWRRILDENVTAEQNDAGESCPPVWDGILCWDRASPGQLLTQRCPAYIAGFHSQANASKFCTDAGVWYTREVNRTWTNFSQCFSGPEATVIMDIEVSPKNESHIEPFLRSLKTISEIGYSVSLASLLVAFFILASVKKLRCPRNVLHMHLFASFIMRAFMSLLKDSLFVQGLGMTTDLLTREEGSYFNIEHQINWPCRTIVSLWQYFIMANYSWILMEGLYLHNLIFLALFSDSSSITMYIVLGWGLPAMFVLPWTLCRALMENTWCWTTNDNTTVFLLIRIPTVASIVVNFILFINIVRVLLLKLKSSLSEETKTYSHLSFPGRLVRRLRLPGRARLSSGVLVSNGRYAGKARHSHPRGSCYSSTSFTTVSVLPSAHYLAAAAAGKKRLPTRLLRR
ncbi:uncharacterized protein GBIM_11452, partial [Gryllus bimaculatus]